MGLKTPRLYLADTIADRLRERLAAGAYAGAMPSERRLAEELGVSRPVLRAALLKLRNEGAVEQAPGRRARAAKPHGKPAAKATAARPVATFLTPYVLADICPASLVTLDRLREALSREGFETRTRTCTGLTGGTPEASLGKLVKNEPCDLWILHQSDERVQHWFEGQHLPTLVLGGTGATSRLPSIESDYTDATREAFNRLTRAGIAPETIALIVPESGPCTHLHAEAAFIEAGGATTHILRHPDSDLAAWIKRNHPIKRVGARAAIVHWPRVAVTVFTHATCVLRARVPEDFALVCLSDDPVLAMCSPEIARFSRDPLKHAATAAKLAMRIRRGDTANGSLRASTPTTFIAGGTLPTRH